MSNLPLNVFNDQLQHLCTLLRKDPIMSVHLKCVKSLLDKKDTAEAAAREYQEENMTLATAASQVREVGGAGFGGLY